MGMEFSFEDPSDKRSKGPKGEESERPELESGLDDSGVRPEIVTGPEIVSEEKVEVNPEALAKEIAAEEEKLSNGSKRLHENIVQLEKIEPKEKDELPLKVLQAKIVNCLDKFTGWLKNTKNSDLFAQMAAAGAIVGILAGGVNMAGIKSISDKLPNNAKELLQSPETMANPILFLAENQEGLNLSTENYRMNSERLESEIASGEKSEDAVRAAAATLNLMVGMSVFSVVGSGLAFAGKGLLRLKKEKKS